MTQETATQKPSNSAEIALVVTACVIGLLMTFLVYSGNFIFGSVKGIWMYRYFDETSTLPRWIPITTLTLLAFCIFIGRKLIHKRETITLIITFILLLFLQFVMREAYPFSLGKIVASDKSNSFYTPSIKYSAIEILKDYKSLSAAFPLHARTNMPGKILFFEFLGLFTSSPEAMGILIVISSSFGGVLLYLICRKILKDKTAAYYSLILYILIPCRLFFLPLLNTVTPIFMLILLALVTSFIENKSTITAWLIGTVTYFMVFFEPSPLTTGLIALGLLIFSVYMKNITLQDMLWLAIHASISFFFLYLAFRTLFSFDLLETLKFILRDATHFNKLAGRGYRIWFGENLKEFFYVAGTPTLVIFMYSTTKVVLELGEISRYKTLSYELAYSLSLLATFTAVVFMGINRGEISRLWIYLAVLFQIPAAAHIAKLEKSALLFYLVAGTLVLQALLPLHLVGFVVP